MKAKYWISDKPTKRKSIQVDLVGKLVTRKPLHLPIEALITRKGEALIDGIGKTLIDGNGKSLIDGSGESNCEC